MANLTPFPIAALIVSGLGLLVVIISMATEYWLKKDVVIKFYVTNFRRIAKLLKVISLYDVPKIVTITLVLSFKPPWFMEELWVCIWKL